MFNLGTDRPVRSGRSYAPYIIYLAGFVILLAAVCHYYLIPTSAVAKHATFEEKKIIAAQARLLLAVVLVVLLVLMIFTFRVRHFFTRSDRRKTTTVYPDAWLEAGKRLKVPPDDDMP